jgi:hypothetical protein
MPTDPNTVNLIWVFTAILLPIIPALLLYKLLPSTADVSGPFHGMQIKLGGAFAGYFLLVLVISFWPRPKPRELAYEVWTLKGQIQDENGTTLPQDKINLNIQPRSVEYLGDGSFEMDILVRRGQSGQMKFPTLLVERQPAQPFGNATIHLDPARVHFGKNYEREVKESLREITIKEPIKLKSVEEKAYVPPPGPLPQPTVLPPSAREETP